MSAANTKDCVRDLIGKKIVGVFFNALPAGHQDLQAGTKTFIFDDGTGFTFNSRGAFWNETADNIARAVKLKEQELRLIEGDIKDVLAVAGIGNNT